MIPEIRIGASAGQQRAYQYNNDIWIGRRRKGVSTVTNYHSLRCQHPQSGLFRNPGRLASAVHRFL